MNKKINLNRKLTMLESEIWKVVIDLVNNKELLESYQNIDGFFSKTISTKKSLDIFKEEIKKSSYFLEVTVLKLIGVQDHSFEDIVNIIFNSNIGMDFHIFCDNILRDSKVSVSFSTILYEIKSRFLVSILDKDKGYF